MLNGKELILATKPYAQEVRWKSWLHTLSTFILMLACYVLVVIAEPIWLKIVLGILTGFVAVRMFVIYHDYMHKTLLQKSQVARWLFTFFGLYILAAPSIWKRSHDYHHKHNSKLYSSSIGSFPTVTKEKYLSFTNAERRRYMFIRHPLTIAFGYLFAFIWGMTVLSLVRSPDKHWDSAIALVLHFGIGVGIYLAFGPIALLTAFFLPAVVACAVGTYLFYAQHNFPGVTFQDKEGWTYTNAALSSSSFMKLNPVMAWFTANIGYHQIHHVNARIPFYRLPEVYDSIPEFDQAKRTSLTPKAIHDCFKCKVWDPESGRMIGRREIYA